jgi:DNA protecting protein DprA
MSGMPEEPPILPFFEDTKNSPTSQSTSLMSTEWLLGLSDLPGIGNSRAISLAKHFQYLERLQSADSLEIKSVVGTSKLDFSRVEPRFPMTEDDVQTVGYFDSNYPPGLRDLRDAPIVLWYRGNIPTQKSIAIVGTRNADDWGKSTTRRISKVASSHGLAVISGLALGVDTEAHIGCIEGGSPTVAILACDVRRPSPKSNSAMADEIILNGGCLIAEVPLGTSTEGRNLVARNRLQAAWAQSLLVTQSGIPSGTLHTVRFALELSRKLLVLKPPPNVHKSQYEGNIALTSEFGFDLNILGGTKEFKEKLTKMKKVTDLDIGSISDFERFLVDVYGN